MDVLESLSRQISSIHTTAMASGGRRLNAEVLRSRWKIGEFLARADQNVRMARKYGAGWMRHLAARLRATSGKGFALTNLYAMRSLYLEYRIGDLAPALSWNHYKILINIVDRPLRQELEREAINRGWSCAELDARVRLRTTSPKRYVFEREHLDFYEARVIEFEAPGYGRVRALDGGFRIVRSEKLEGFATGSILQWTPQGTLRPTEREEPSYLYLAKVERIIDGDTFQAMVDLGAGQFHWREFRLRGVDTPELDAAGGHRMRDWLAARMPAESVVALRSHQSDKYRRYLADVVYLSQAQDRYELLREGVWLNEELREAGFGAN